jgi:hypothetical protein
MRRRREGGLEAMGSLVGKVYPSQQPEEVRAMRVFGAFGKVVSARVQGNAGPVAFRNGVLTVHTTTSSWANALSLESGQIIARLRLRLPDVPVQRIAFRVGKLPQLPETVAEEKPAAKLLPLTHLPEEVARELARIGDDGLREAVAHAASISLAEPAPRPKKPRHGL